MKLFPKQLWALNLFTDSVTKEVGYGGAAGGGKSYLGVYCLIVCASELKGSKWFIGRDSLKDTRESVLFTFRKVSKELGFQNWKYRDNHIYFDNGSEIEFLDLSFYPIKDPLYERFGSKEYTGGWVEEAGNVHPLAYDVLKTRVGRWFNKEFGMVGTVLVTFNPKKNWVDSTFYRPWKNKKETKTVRFIRALWNDNPDLPEDYVAALHAIKDKSTRERLLNGNFDYDDDPNSLINYEDIMNMWLNTHIPTTGKRYITADIARFGSDKAILLVWDDWVVIDYLVFSKSATTKIQNAINALRTKYNVPASRTIGDEDGVGGGVIDNCSIIGFKNGGAAPDKGYYRLKDQCGYMVAENIHKMHWGAPVNDETKEIIEQELSQLKTFDADKDGKLRILPKVKIKENIGRSPDWLDNFIMRQWFELYNPSNRKEAYEKALGLFT